MSTYFLAAFLILFGLLQLIAINIPHWVLGVLALATALALIIGAPWRKP